MPCRFPEKWMQGGGPPSDVNVAFKAIIIGVVNQLSYHSSAINLAQIRPLFPAIWRKFMDAVAHIEASGKNESNLLTEAMEAGVKGTACLMFIFMYLRTEEPVGRGLGCHHSATDGQ